MTPVVYIRTDKPAGKLYTGVTSNLSRRNQDYLSGYDPDSYVNRHSLMCLVHVEFFETMAEAIQREKVLKKMPRNRKLKLITHHNPEWQDLTRLVES